MVITDGILNGLHAVVVGLLSLIPTVSIPWGSSDFGELIVVANMVMPISEMFSILRILLGVATVMVTVWLILKVIDWLPFT